MQETQETRVPSLGGEDPLEEEIATCSSILAWRIPWTEESGGLGAGTEQVYNDPVLKACLWGTFLELIHSFEFLGISPPLMFLLITENPGSEFSSSSLWWSTGLESVVLYGTAAHIYPPCTPPPNPVNPYESHSLGVWFSAGRQSGITCWLIPNQPNWSLQRWDRGMCGFNNFWLRAITWRQWFSKYLAAAAASAGNLLEIQIPGTRPNHPGSETLGVRPKQCSVV